MPTKRFYNLDIERQNTILDAARKEFVENGFRDASLNGIIKNAGISKGSLYYYFEDKSDLYLTVIEGAFEEMFGSAVHVDGHLTRENFWLTFKGQTLMYMQHVKERPELVKLSRDLYQVTEAPHASEAIADFTKKIQDMYSVFFLKGRELGEVRDDIPLDLICSLITHMGAALDLWVFERWEDFDLDDLDSYALKYSDMVKKIASPVREEGGKE